MINVEKTKQTKFNIWTWCLELFYDSKCQYCGKPFNKTHKNEKYCSDICRHKAQREQLAAFRKKNRKIVYDKYPVKCQYCGKPFIRKYNTEKYCSEDCKHKALQDNKATYQRKRRKSINNGYLISNENNYVGTNYLSGHRRKDEALEAKMIQKEMKRLQLR